MDASAQQLTILWHIALAMGFGGVIGLQREMADKPAGLRTHMMVAGAAALFAALSTLSLQHYSDTRGDPTRIFQAIVMGVSFIGAGTIIHRSGGEGVQGLTTAASLLVSAGVGVAVMQDQLILALGISVLALIVLTVIHIFDRVIHEGAHKVFGNGKCDHDQPKPPQA
jgi:putative Mg2+ transporter-C (MgtC) family protein